MRGVRLRLGGDGGQRLGIALAQSLLAQRRAHRLGQPRLRGVSHAYAFWAASATAALLTVLAPSGTARFGALIYGGGLCALFGGSALSD